MKKTWIWALLPLVLLLGGCLGITGPFGSGGPAIDGGLPSGPSTVIPATDAELRPHVAGELVVGLWPGADPGAVAAAVGAEIIDTVEQVDAVHLRLPDGSKLTDAMRALSGLRDVRYAEPNFTGMTAFDVDPDDPAFVDGTQWGVREIGAPAAWNASIFGDGIVIAVIDTGVDPDHEELSDRLLTGWNLLKGSTDTSDPNGHGTHIAGIAAARGNNGAGIAGVAWEAEILPITALNADGLGDYFTAALAILLASDPDQLEVIAGHRKAADVINLSLGGVNYSRFLHDAIDYAIGQGIVVVAAMGNTGNQQLMYPARFPGVIAVGATDPFDRKASFSTTGDHISVAAPGYRIYSTVAGGYGVKSGTSMATPYVSGAVALILSEHPHLSPAEVKRLLEETATQGYFTRELGYGRIDVARALELEAPTNPTGWINVQVVVKGLDVEIPGADVLLFSDGAVVTNILTDELGRAVFPDLDPNKEYALVASLNRDRHGAIGHGSVSGITVSPNAGVDVTIEVDALPAF